MDMWRIAEAKQQFSEVVRRSGGAPQKIYRRDRLAAVVSPEVLATIEAVRRQQSPCTLAEAFSDLRSACLEERYELELPERRDRVGCRVRDAARAT